MKSAILICASLVLVGSAIAVSARHLGAPAGSPEIGASAPAFSATDTKGNTVSLESLKGKYVVLEWCNFGCPYVQKHYNGGNMQALQKKYAAKGVKWITVFSSAAGAEGGLGSVKLNQIAKDKNISSILVPDSEGTLGKMYGSKNTPTMFVIDPTGKLIYKGAIDDQPTMDPASIKGAKNYVAAALDEAMAGKPVTTPVTKPYGCGIFYKQ